MGEVSQIYYQRYSNINLLFKLLILNLTHDFFQIVQMNGNEIKIKFMDHGKSGYFWPQTDDISWEAVDAIEEILQDPQLAPCSTSNRLFYIF